MSTFSGIGTALSSLIAQRQALDVSAQNVANANTVGYTRQRVDLVPVGGQSVPAMFATSDGVGTGTRVAGVQRLGDSFLDTKVRTSGASSAYLAARADALRTLETGVGEPADTGMAAQLSDFWAGWADVANGSDKDAARAVLLERGTAVASRLHTLYGDARTQWQQAHATTTALVDRVNTAATSVAELNEAILAIENSGGRAHELADQRDLLVTELSSLVGATVRTRDNGQLDVLVGGNALVTGDDVSRLAVTGAGSFSQATSGTATTVVWADHPTVAAGLTSGRVAGLLSVLAPADDGGVLTGAARGYDQLATTVADRVNALHASAVRPDGTPGGDFFTFTSGQPAALGLTVALTSGAQVAAGAPGAGAFDGSVAARLARLGATPDGPDTLWRATVTDLGVRTASSTSRAKVAETALTAAQQQQLAQTSVDLDEETVSMLAYQRAYEGAARVLTAIDEMLDTLINRTGVVGR